MVVYQEDQMTPAEATEVAATIRSSFDWPADAEIVAFRSAEHNASPVEFAVHLPGAQPQDVEVIEFCFRNGHLASAETGVRRPYRVVVFAEPVGIAPETDGWIGL
jgi:hypothetical protein